MNVRKRWEWRGVGVTIAVGPGVGVSVWLRRITVVGAVLLSGTATSGLKFSADLVILWSGKTTT